MKYVIVVDFIITLAIMTAVMYMGACTARIKEQARWEKELVKRGYGKWTNEKIKAKTFEWVEK